MAENEEKKEAEQLPEADARPWENDDPSSWEARVAGINPEALLTELDKVDAYFKKHVDELDYRNFDTYLRRANLRFALGASMMGVVDDLFMAARCLHKRRDLHFAKLPHERFLSRRVVPVELGFLSGQPLVCIDMATHYGLPLAMLLARDADDDTFREGSLLTTYFRRGSVTSHQDLAGLGAVIYAGAISAIGRGFDDEAALGLNVFGQASQPYQGRPAGGAAKHLQRYDTLNLALACLIRGQWEQLGNVLGVLADNFVSDERAKKGDDFKNGALGVRYIDTSVAAFLAMSALRSVAVPLPETGAVASYIGFVEVFTTVPPRELEKQELDPESRMLLAQMGMDPDKVEADLHKQAAEAQRALIEAQEAAQLEQARIQGMAEAPGDDNE